MDSRQDRSIARRAVPGLIAALLLLSGCSSPGIDEPLTTAVSDAISAGASAQLGLEQSERSRILPGTLTALLGDMEQALADAERQLQMHQTQDAEDADFRAEALAEVRDSLEAVHVAQSGEHAAALAALTDSVERLRELEDAG
jgi:hypothetical protein